MNTLLRWPQKQRELHNHHMDSTRWNDFRFRDDDIVIATWAKSGTTWMQQIIGQLVSGGADTSFAFMASPWLDLRVMPKDEVFAQLEAQQHRRFIKTHTPLDGLVLDDGECVGLGTHDDLLAACETYREIVGSQLSAEEAERATAGGAA